MILAVLTGLTAVVAAVALIFFMRWDFQRKRNHLVEHPEDTPTREQNVRKVAPLPIIGVLVLGGGVIFSSQTSMIYGGLIVFFGLAAVLAEWLQLGRGK